MRERESGRTLRVSSAVFVGLVGTLLMLAGSAAAHPLSQGALDVVVHPDRRVTVRARVTLEEVVITDLMTTPIDAVAGGKPAGAEQMYARHARYLAEHVMVAADGVPLAGRVVRAGAPSTQPSTQPVKADQEHVVYEFEYAPPGAGSSHPPAKVTLRQDVLVGVEMSPGVTWEAAYVVRMAAAGGPVSEGLLLTSKQPLEYACDWQAAAAGTGAAVDRGHMLHEYVRHGVHHILGGYDHLLFIGALVLAARSVMDLVKVVTAFTVAHTITLALAALRLVHVPSSVVEPMIAASIVFVALQNVLWPAQSRGRARLAVAFGFGLFHGLGFAGGLLEAMQGMSGLIVALAIAGFSLGVEIGHQMIVLPLFGALKLARRTRTEAAERDRVSLLALRYGSAVICLAGMYYLVAALSSAFAVAQHT
jgi:hypothetical protein